MLEAAPRPEKPAGDSKTARGNLLRTGRLKTRKDRSKELENQKVKSKPKQTPLDEEKFKEEIRRKARIRLAEERQYLDQCFLSIGPAVFEKDMWNKMESEFRSYHPMDTGAFYEEGPALERHSDSKSDDL